MREILRDDFRTFTLLDTGNAVIRLQNARETLQADQPYFSLETESSRRARYLCLHCVLPKKDTVARLRRLPGHGGRIESPGFKVFREVLK